MAPTLTRQAPLDTFRSLTPEILYGELLNDVRQIGHSILKDGLLNPLTTSENNQHLMVIDGRKRLAALRRLQFKSELPTSLENIPYTPFEEVCAKQTASRRNAMSLVDNADQYNRVKAARRAGRSVMEIAEDLYCSPAYVRDLIRVDYLGGDVRAAFLSGALNLSHVRAFSTIENPAAQDALLLRLGTKINDQEILRAISRGDSIVEVDPENTIILPSRRGPLPHLPDAA